MNILLIITIAALALALSSIGVAFSFKKAYDKKREESKEALKKYASIQYDHTLQAGVIQDLRDQITVLDGKKIEIEAKHNDLLDLHKKQLEHNSNQFSTIKKLESRIIDLELELLDVDLDADLDVDLDVDAETENECCKLKAENAELKEVINHYEVNRQNQEIFREQIEKLKK